MYGELIGINTAIATDGFSRSNAGVGFAVPINQVMRVVEDLIDGGKVRRGFLGVTIGAIDDDMMKALKLDSKKGVLISFVSKDSPADLSGLKEKDIITSMNGIEVQNVNELRNNVSNAKPGDVINFGIIRDGYIKNITVTLGLRPDQDEVVNIFSGSRSNSFDLLGLKVKSNDKGDGIVITSIDKSSNAYEKNIRTGDIITEIGSTIINSVDDYNSIIEKYNSGDAIMLRIISNGNARYEAFEIN